MSDSFIYMSIKLVGDFIFFLFFNCGDEGCVGNFVGELGFDGQFIYLVSYFWMQVFQKDNWLCIFYCFVLLEKKESKDVKGNMVIKENIIFLCFY